MVCTFVKLRMQGNVEIWLLKVILGLSVVTRSAGKDNQRTGDLCREIIQLIKKFCSVEKIQRKNYRESVFTQIKICKKVPKILPRRRIYLHSNKSIC